MKIIKIIGLLILCTSCTQLVETGNKANSAVRKGIYRSADKVQELTRYSPPPTTPQAPQVGYCYNTMSDIVCYEIPQPHISNKLVGFQGAPVSPELLPAPTDANTLTSQQVMMQDNGGRTTPFYIKEAPYIRADGEVVTSSKILPMMPPTGTSYAPVQLAPPADQTGSPRRLMPRY